MPDPKDYDFELPEAQIAQRPLAERAESRLLKVPRDGGPIEHARFRALPELIPPGAVLVVNDTKVIQARLVGTRPTGGRVEVFLLRPLDTGDDSWEAWIKPSARVRLGMQLSFDGGLVVTPAERIDERWAVRLSGPGDIDALIEVAGRLPLPPYIQREAGEDDGRRYQTVFARASGAVAAPTAGLHFDAGVLEALRARGVTVLQLTLHVGAGTFAPLRQEQLETGRLHPERYEIAPAVWSAVQEAKAQGRPVVAVGTTVTRALESAARDPVAPALSGETTLFITPGFEFRVVDHLITNFHLPRSSLLMLVSAFAGRERVLQAYRVAVEAGYRFFSYGDATIFI